MKNTTKLIAACALLAGATATFASGTHAGGHGHDTAQDGGHSTAAIGLPGAASKVRRTITIEMGDTMRFTPSTIQVRRGETIRFIVRNNGQLQHEFNLGTEADLKAHAELMKKFPGMVHDEPNIASVAPGQTGEIVWQFTKTGPVHFACLHPGHFDAGMKGTITVGAAK